MERERGGGEVREKKNVMKREEEEVRVFGQRRQEHTTTNNSPWHGITRGQHLPVSAFDPLRLLMRARPPASCSRGARELTK